MSNEEWLGRVNRRVEQIVCPVCGSIENAIVYETYPFELYAHICSKCGYQITESEWHKNE